MKNLSGEEQTDKKKIFHLKEKKAEISIRRLKKKIFFEGIKTYPKMD